MATTAIQSKAKRMAGPSRRAQLLEKAKEIVRDHGASQLSLATLAAECGVTKPVAYNHFGSRDLLLCELYQNLGAEHEARAKEALAVVRQSGGQASQAAMIIAEAFIDCALQNGSLYEEIMSALRASADGKRMCDALRDNIARSYAGIMTQLGFADGQAILQAQGLIAAGERFCDGIVKGWTTREDAVALLARLLMPRQQGALGA